MLKQTDKCLPAGHKKTCSMYLFTEIYKNITLRKKNLFKASLPCPVVTLISRTQTVTKTFYALLSPHLKLAVIAKDIVTSAIFLLTDKQNFQQPS